MSELKVRKLLDEDGCLVEVFDADETIRYIARHKYKRCVAMAKLCNEKWLVHNFAEIPTKLGFYDRWEKRWLELAEKFKPNH